VYQFEILASPRGRRWYLTRRVAEEDSVACRSHSDLTSEDPALRRIYLSSVFLNMNARMNLNELAMSFSVMVGARVPDYEVAHKFWFNDHFEGGYLFREQFIVEVAPPELTGKGTWDVRCRRLEDQPGTSTVEVTISQAETQMLIEIPVGSATNRPGIAGKLQILASPWNNSEKPLESAPMTASENG
jgi:hypothetical protein